MRGLEGWNTQADESESTAWGAFKGLSMGRRDADEPGNSKLDRSPVTNVRANSKPQVLHSRVTQASGSRVTQALPASKKQLNILLLGETGVGKSTMINAFANYITFESMEEALSSDLDLVALVRMSFTHVDNQTFESHLIELGEADPNEIHNAGQAATQACRTYTFPFSEDLSVHIIDTPGIGDTRGVEQDQINFNGILAYLENYDVIHGICFLLKPNSSRLTVTFRFCIKELLCRLHKSASDNIVFLFTYTRGTCYGPGETVIPLKVLLKQVQDSPPHVVIPFNVSTVYCVDNEAFRLVLASKKGFSFTDSDKLAFSESWVKSAKQCRRMLEHFASITPHNVIETVSVNRAAQLVKNLQEPMSTVTRLITENMENFLKQQEELRRFKGNQIELKAKIEIHELELKAEEFQDGAATVCTNERCGQKIVCKETGEVEMRMKICHQPCTSASSVTSGDKASWFCSTINLFGNCKTCKCPMGMHQRITYVPHVKAKRRALEKAVAEQVAAGDAVQARKLQIKIVEKIYEEYEEEAEAISQAAARFAYFFKNNAITAYNDSMKDYVDQQIAVEKGKADCSRALLERLAALKVSYDKEWEEVKRLAAQGKGDSSAEGVMKTGRGLYNLMHTGATLRNLVEKVNNVEQRTALRREKVCTVPPSSNFRQQFKRFILDQNIFL